MNCRHCSQELTHPFIDLGSSPPSNSYLTESMMRNSERWYPLRVMVCHNCWLVQTEDFVGVEEMFSEDYAYFSSYSTSWLAHAKKYVAEMESRFHLTPNSLVVEVAANDGYLLQYVKAAGVKALGIEPTHSTARAAREKGIDVVEEFFGVELAQRLVREGIQADLTAANNVLAHVPDINDFVKGFSILLSTNGVATFEFPHLLNLVKKNQFDTIYHEHYSYLSLTAVNTIFSKNNLSIFDVEAIETHGGSLRVYAQNANTDSHAISGRVKDMLMREQEEGITNPAFYADFTSRVEKLKYELIEFLIDARRENKKVAGYGAAAKGNTMLNYAGIRSDLIQFVVDRNPAKQNKYMPGSRIPIFDEEKIKVEKPDYVIILPWNLKLEVLEQLDYVRGWGGKFVVAIPKLEIV